MKEYWCEAPAHLQSLPIELWRNISQTEDGCQVFDYPWNTVTAADISVGLLTLTIPLFTTHNITRSSPSPAIPVGLLYPALDEPHTDGQVLQIRVLRR